MEGKGRVLRKKGERKPRSLFEYRVDEGVAVEKRKAESVRSWIEGGGGSVGSGRGSGYSFH